MKKPCRRSREAEKTGALELDLSGWNKGRHLAPIARPLWVQTDQRLVSRPYFTPIARPFLVYWNPKIRSFGAAFVTTGRPLSIQLQIHPRFAEKQNVIREVRAHFANLRSEQSRDAELKIFILGNGGGGKTQLSRRLRRLTLTQRFRQPTESSLTSLKPTLAVART
jgi:hypothetical protein